MFEIIKNVISEGRYALNDILKKIDTIWLQGDLTDDERTELMAMAREHALPENSFAPLQKQIDILAVQVTALKSEIELHSKYIEAINTAISNLGGEVSEPEEPVQEEYPSYVQPTGAHDAYHRGDKITFTDGKKYECIAPEGVAVVWDPVTYPAYWQEVIEDAEQ